MKKSYLSKIGLLLLILCAIVSTSKAIGWEKLDSLSSPNPFPVMAAVDGKIYMLSGSQGGPIATRVYDPATNCWSSKANIPDGSIYSTCNVVDGKIYVMGGGQYNQKQDNHYIYDPATDIWTEGAPLLTPRMYHSSAVVNGKIYLIGGQNGDGTTEWYFDEYDPATDSWTRKENTPHKDAWYCAAVGVGNKFYRIGGGRYAVPTQHFDCYDTETDRWEILDPMSVALHAPVALNVDGNIMLMGGYANMQTIDSIYQYYPEHQMWVLMMNHLPEPMSYHKAVVSYPYIYLYHKVDGGAYGRLWRYQYAEIGVEETENDGNKIQIIPNPAAKEFSVILPPTIKSGIKVNMYLVSGVELPIDYEIDRTIDRINIKAPTASAGYYYIRLSDGINIYSEPVLIK